MPGFKSLYNGADAQKVADEIVSIGESATPEEIVEKARGTGTELHKCFEWDDTKAAEKYRLHQARQVIHHLVIKQEEQSDEKPEIHFFHKTENNAGYKTTMFIMSNPDEYQKLLARAYQELRWFKEKYKTLSELDEIFDLIP